MQATKTRQVANLIGKGHMIFNDKLADGTRSLKVWGWKEAEYELAKKMLEMAGCQVKFIKANKYSQRGGNYTMRRLHVQE